MSKDNNENNKSFFKSAVDKVIDLLSSVFLPIINLMVSVGILKGILELLKVSNVISQGSSTYEILTAMSDSFFYFIPVFLAFTAAKKFKAEPFTAAVIAATLLYPNITNLMTGSEAITFFNIPIKAVSYSASIIPILLAVYFMSYLEKLCKKIIPETFVGMLTPPICILIVVPITLIVFGPIGMYVGSWMAKVYEWLYSLSPLIAGFLIGLVQQIMVIFGLHWGLFPIALNNNAVYGFDTLMPLFGAPIFAQGGAALAVALKAKTKEFKSIAFSASFTTLLGITEPALFSVNIRLKTPMICACIAGGVGSAIAGFFGCRATTFALPALTTLPVFMSKSFVPFLIALGVGFFLAFALTMIVKIENLEEIESK
ncbi:MAG: PTS transporter subunit EIIC [Clostridioides sp.]|jgi:PTS system beta-glucosides-specific IIC component|nr:PTS transporter subunit EIIC [Clostridioides sp.]